MTQERLSGLIAAPFTAMKKDGSINLDAVEKHVELLINNGVKGAFICGTTGEGLSLSVEERMTLAKRWREAAGDDLAIIVHVSHTCLSDCQALAAHAEQIGANSIGVMPPFFFKPGSVDDLASYCAQVASAAGDLPFYLYHIPVMTGVKFPIVDFLKSASEKIPTLAGVKFTNEDLMDFGLCLNLHNGKYNMLFGRDEILLAALSLGAKGAVGSTYNYAAPLYKRLIEAFNTGNLKTAGDLQSKSIRMVKILSRYGTLSAGKAAMKLVGVDCGPVRPPVRKLTDADFQNLSEQLRNIGFEDFCSLKP